MQGNISNFDFCRALKCFEAKSKFFFCPCVELERDADEEKIKSAYRRLAKFYHPDGLFILQIWRIFHTGLFINFYF